MGLKCLGSLIGRFFFSQYLCCFRPLVGEFVNVERWLHALILTILYRAFQHPQVLVSMDTKGQLQFGGSQKLYVSCVFIVRVVSTSNSHVGQGQPYKCTCWLISSSLSPNLSHPQKHGPFQHAQQIAQHVTHSMCYSVRGRNRGGEGRREYNRQAQYCTRQTK